MANSSAAGHDLTQGGVFSALLKLALPIMATQFMQMLYNLTDMFWLGRLGSDAVASSGTAGLFMWLSVGLMLIGRVGAEIGVSQSRGRGDMPAAYGYARTALIISAGLGLVYAAFIFSLRTPLVGLFNFKEANVAADTAMYLGIVAVGIPLTYVTSAVVGIFNASGNSKVPFMLNAVGLVMNVVLDPLLIMAAGMGVAGAAVATVIAQTVVVALMLAALKSHRQRPFAEFIFFKGLEMTEFKLKMKQIFKWTVPICLENTLFCFLTMLTSRFEVGFGAEAVAISRVGSQVESLSWLVGAGFGSALTTYVGQNFGAGKQERIDKGVRIAAVFMACWGLFVMLVLFLGGGFIFTAFLPDPALRVLGITYMQTLAFCQIPANLEAVGGNAFKGTGRTLPPSVTSISINALRVPFAYLLSRTALGLPGIWIVVSVTAAMRGIVINLWYALAERKRKKAIPLAE
jgi:putative MATE family efflux protein